MRSRKELENMEAALSCSVESRVRFSELDPMCVMWHGNYLRLFEDAREEFGRRFDGIGYMQMYEAGFTAPVVDLHISYHSPLAMNDCAVIEISYYPEAAARLRFGYKGSRKSDGMPVCSGESTQVFVDTKGNMSLVKPEFFKDWEKKWLKA